MIWLPQIPHFMMRESMPSSSECCEECNSTACQAAWTKCNCSPRVVAREKLAEVLEAGKTARPGLHLDRDVIRDVNAIGRGQQLLQAARLGAGWHLQVHRDGGTLLARDEQGLSHASSPRVPMPRNAEEEFTRGAREGVLLS